MAVVMSLPFVETHRRAKMNGKPSKVVLSMVSISSDTYISYTATTLT